jgi:hypothetical protein
MTCDPHSACGTSLCQNEPEKTIQNEETATIKNCAK